MADLRRVTDATLRASGPGKHRIDDGLYFVVRDGRKPSWVVRYQLDGKRREMSLGTYPFLGLADARRQAIETRQVVRSGLDPLEERKRADEERRQSKAEAAAEAEEEAANAVTFREIADEFFRLHQPRLKGGGKAGRWFSPIETHVLPLIGDKAVTAVTREDMLDLFDRVRDKIPTARKIADRVGLILDHAADDRGLDVDRALGGLRSFKRRLAPLMQAHRTENIEALPWQEVPGLFAELAHYEGSGPRALQFTMLTAMRSAPVRHARVRQFQPAEDQPGTMIWTVPGEIMKSKVGKEADFRVPIPQPAVDLWLAPILTEAGNGDALLFPGMRGGAISDMTMSRHLSRMGVKARPHGFRSSFIEWAVANGVDLVVAKKCLGHSTASIAGGSVTAAYLRSDMLDARVSVMKAWVEHVTSEARA